MCIRDRAGARSNATTNAREYVVNLTLTSDGVEAFSKATEELAPTKGRIYIMYNGEVLSAPTVNEHIASDTCSITGMGDLEAAQTLASNIRIGALPCLLYTSFDRRSSSDCKLWISRDDNRY